MCKRFFCILIFFLILSIPQLLFSQSGRMARVSVFPLENPEKDLQVEVISINIQKTIEFNLKIINKFNIIPNNITDYSSDIAWLLNYCEKNNIDELIFGKALMQANGSVFIEMSVFNKRKAATTLTKTETADTVLEIFGAADKIAVEMMDSFSGMVMGYGELKFTNSGEKGTYSVYIDNIFAGENINNFSRIVIGQRQIVITQERMFGNIKIFDKAINITEDKITEIIFSIPGFLEKESNSIVKLETYIEKNWDKKYSSKDVEKSFNSLLKLLTITEYSQTAAEKKKEVEEKFAQWNVKKQDMGINNVLSMLDKPLGISIYGAANVMAPTFNEDGTGKWESNNNFTAKAGVAVSVNFLSYFALRAEFAMVQIDASAKEESTDTKKLTAFNMAEIPLLLLLRVPPDKLLSIYAGGVYQLYMSGDKNLKTYGSSDVFSLKSSGQGLVLGALFEIPLSSYVFLSFDIRYTRSLTNWIEDKSAEFFITYFHMGLGLGLKI